MLEAVIIGSICGGALVGFIAGVLIERIRWNELIKDGIIKTPSSRAATGWSPHTWFKGARTDNSPPLAAMAKSPTLEDM